VKLALSARICPHEEGEEEGVNAVGVGGVPLGGGGDCLYTLCCCGVGARKEEEGDVVL
jgi:hypothetical protein